MRRFFLILLLACSLGAQVRKSPDPEPHPNCCLCMCRNHDETTCSRMCIRLQHGKKIVELPQMEACTKSCKRHGVKPMPE